MIVIDPGHNYQLDTLDGDATCELRFVKRFRGRENHPGTTNQEVLRVLIDRVIELNSEKPWPLNNQILHHLRMALILHEARALVRKVEKGELMPEGVVLKKKDGHFSFKENMPGC